MVLEESGLEAAHRRLLMLRVDRKPSPEPDMLWISANARVRLDERAWIQELTDTIEEIQPRAIFLDPFVRLKGDADENSQKELRRSLRRCATCATSAGAR